MLSLLSLQMCDYPPGRWVHVPMSTVFKFIDIRCRQVANLEASVAEPEDASEMIMGDSVEEDDMDIVEGDSFQQRNAEEIPTDSATTVRPTRPELSPDGNFTLENRNPSVRGEVAGSSIRPTTAVNIPGNSHTHTSLDNLISPSTPLNSKLMYD